MSLDDHVAVVLQGRLPLLQLVVVPAASDSDSCHASQVTLCSATWYVSAMSFQSQAQPGITLWACSILCFPPA